MISDRQLYSISVCCSENPLIVEIEEDDLYFDPIELSEEKRRLTPRMLPTTPLPHSQFLWRFERKPGSRMEDGQNNEAQLVNPLSYFRLAGRFRSVEDEYWDWNAHHPNKDFNNNSAGLRRIFVQMRRVPINVTKKEIVEWFKPLVQVEFKNVFIHQNGYKAEVYFATGKEAKRAMQKDGHFMLKKCVELYYIVDVLKSVRSKLLKI